MRISVRAHIETDDDRSVEPVTVGAIERSGEGAYMRDAVKGWLSWRKQSSHPLSQSIAQSVPVAAIGADKGEWRFIKAQKARCVLFSAGVSSDIRNGPPGGADMPELLRLRLEPAERAAGRSD